MQLIQAVKGMAASCILLASVMMIPGVEPAAGAGEHEWLDVLVQAVLVEQAKEERGGDLFVPYVEQLTVVRGHLLKDDSEAVYRSMNRFMEMLQVREQGIAAEAADRLFDYCYLVTPPRYHDVSRHLHRMS